MRLFQSNILRYVITRTHYLRANLVAVIGFLTIHLS